MRSQHPSYLRIGVCVCARARAARARRARVCVRELALTRCGARPVILRMCVTDISTHTRERVHARVR